MPGLIVPDAVEAFLGRPRVGTLILRSGAPLGIPVWFQWTGSTIEMFSGTGAAKVRHLRQDPAASFLIANEAHEDEFWVAFDGTVTISDDGGIALATRLAERYWDLADPAKRAALESWQAVPEAFCVLTLTPERVRVAS